MRILLKVSGKVKPSAPHKNKMNKIPKTGHHNLDVCVITNWEVWFLLSTVWRTLPKDFWDREDSALSAVVHFNETCRQIFQRACLKSLGHCNVVFHRRLDHSIIGFSWEHIQRNQITRYSNQNFVDIFVCYDYARGQLSRNWRPHDKIQKRISLLLRINN